MLLNPVRLGGSKFTHSAWGRVNLTPLKYRRWRQKSPRLWLHIDLWSIKDFLSHLRARYDKKWKNHHSISENPEKKSKIFGFKNYELDMVDTVFRPQEHDALGWKMTLKICKNSKKSTYEPQIWSKAVPHISLKVSEPQIRT